MQCMTKSKFGLRNRWIVWRRDRGQGYRRCGCDTTFGPSILTLAVGYARCQEYKDLRMQP
jgi:hypothetical protein